MWIVRLALRRPYTFVVAAMLTMILGVVIILNMPTDIFPEIDIPVISVVFNYTGMAPSDMEARITTPFERILTTTVNDIEHIESQSLNGVGVVKIYFQKNAKIEAATAQVTAVSQTAIRQMPSGTQPPLIIRYNASSVPILQLSIGSDTLPEQDLFDNTVNGVRLKLITVPGVQIPFPYGGKQRQIMIDLDNERLFAYGISPADVSGAVNAQNLILPSGTTKIGTQEYPIALNASPEVVNILNDLPIKTVNGKTIYIRDVAHARDGFQVQTNVVHVDGKRGVLLSILKAGGVSTLDVVSGIKKVLPDINIKGLNITPMFDQSVFVRASVQGVVKEAAIAAGLTAMMILLFLGSWRSTVIVMISIPLSIMVSIIILAFLGQTLNVMTLGGMALAVGILVDDATVEIENIHRNLHQRKRLVQAILDGASQIAVPAFVSTLCICIVFVPVVFISGAAKYLFTPLAMSVVFAMMTSYLLSRTLVPTMVHYLLAAEVEMYGGVVDESDPHAMHRLHARDARERGQPVAIEDQSATEKLAAFLRSTAGRIVLMVLVALLAVLVTSILLPRVPGMGGAIGIAQAGAHGWVYSHWVELAQTINALAAIIVGFWLIIRLNLIWTLHHAFNRQFEKLRRGYGGLLAWTLAHRAIVVAGFVLFVAISSLLFVGIGQDFFPGVDAGQIRMHVRCPPGTRIEQTEQYFADVENVVRDVIPADQRAAILDNMGIPNSSINLSLSDGSLMSPADGEILVALGENHRPTAQYMRQLRTTLREKFPNLIFFFAPADIVTQVLNFGLQSSIDVQFTGPSGNFESNYAAAHKLERELAAVPGVVDLRFQQVPHTPQIKVNVDRTLASQLGMTQANVASNLLISLSSSLQTAPNFWLNHASNVQYSILVQTPQYWMNSINELGNTPISPPGQLISTATQLLSNLATITRESTATNITHYNIETSVDVLMSLQGRDLASTGRQIQEKIDAIRNDLAPRSRVIMRGQIQSMYDSFNGLGYGLIFAVLLVYLLLVINFQSWVDPLIILMALPGAMAGILLMLWATQTNISVPALMGAIMSIGVATANSILLITFANDQRLEGMNAMDAALAAGLTRLRPVIMTALAMIIGMLPMSLGLGEGGEQNAPLGRAVIGGLSMATFATLFFVPVVYSLLRTKAPELHIEEELK